MAPGRGGGAGAGAVGELAQAHSSSRFVVLDDPLREPSDVFFRRSREASVRKLECSFWIETDREAKLIPELLGEVAGHQAVRNAFNKLMTLLRGEATVFQPATHHCPRSPVPEAPRFGADELNTTVDCRAIA